MALLVCDLFFAVFTSVCCDDVIPDWGVVIVMPSCSSVFSKNAYSLVVQVALLLLPLWLNCAWSSVIINLPPLLP